MAFRWRADSRTILHAYWRVGGHWANPASIQSRATIGPPVKNCNFVVFVTPIVGVCNCSVFCCTLLYVHSSFASILMGKRGLVALLSLSSWCLVIVVWLILAVPWVCLQFVFVVFFLSYSLPIFVEINDQRRSRDIRPNCCLWCLFVWLFAICESAILSLFRV